MKKRKPSKRKLIFDHTGLKAFALQLKKVREAEDLTQSQLAFEAKVSLSQIARIETARINPTLSTIFSLARAMRVPLIRLFEFDLPGRK